MRKRVTVRKVDAVRQVGDHEALVIDGVDITDYHSPRDLFHAGEYRVFMEAGVMLPGKPGRPWASTPRSQRVLIYPTSDFTEIFEAMMMLAHHHDGCTTEDYLQIRDTDFGPRLGVVPAG